MSESRRAAANEWFDSTLYSRLNDKTKGAIVIVMQRLHEDDLVGHALEKEGWDVVSFPAIAEERRASCDRDAARAARSFAAAPAKRLHPERESARDARPHPLDGRRISISPPSTSSGRRRPAAAWSRRPGSSAMSPSGRPGFDRIVQSWDTANKPSELADYSVCTTWGLKGPKFYLLNVMRKKLSYPDLKRAVMEQDRLFRPQAILIEDKASGTQLIQELIEAGCSRVTRVSPEGDKIMRLHAQTATIENGFVFLPEAAPWLADYLAELTTFPAGRWDDQVDSTAQFLAWTKRRTGAEAWIEFYREPWQGRGGLLPPG